jgi:hypothetical protein
MMVTAVAVLMTAGPGPLAAGMISMIMPRFAFARDHATAARRCHFRLGSGDAPMTSVTSTILSWCPAVGQMRSQRTSA